MRSVLVILGLVLVLAVAGAATFYFRTGYGPEYAVARAGIAAATHDPRAFHEWVDLPAAIRKLLEDASAYRSAAATRPPNPRPVFGMTPQFAALLKETSAERLQAAIEHWLRGGGFDPAQAGFAPEAWEAFLETMRQGMTARGWKFYNYQAIVQDGAVVALRLHYRLESFILFVDLKLHPVGELWRITGVQYVFETMAAVDAINGFGS